MDFHLKDKIALVIGASRSRGYATAHLLTQEDVRVAANGRIKAASTRLPKKSLGKPKRRPSPYPVVFFLSLLFCLFSG
jgi:NAD(P)-dependent dehydrogenase (short-subunit alcohol dehydrogenase family)